MRMVLRTVINVLTHLPHVTDGEDRIEHFSLLAMMVTFMIINNQVRSKSGSWQT